MARLWILLPARSHVHCLLAIRCGDAGALAHTLHACAHIPRGSCRCNQLVQQVDEAPAGRGVVHLLDDISDRLCHATDAANFCTQAHADARWRAASHSAAQRLNAYMAQLNTDERLHRALSAAMQQAEHADRARSDDDGAAADGGAGAGAGGGDAAGGAAGWTQEERKVGASLLLEFEQAGMGQDEQKSREYRQLIAQEQDLCAKLLHFEVRGAGPSVCVTESVAHLQRV